MTRAEFFTELGDTTPYKGVGGCGGERDFFIVRSLVRESVTILQKISGK